MSITENKMHSNYLSLLTISIITIIEKGNLILYPQIIRGEKFKKEIEK